MRLGLLRIGAKGITKVDQDDRCSRIFFFLAEDFERLSQGFFGLLLEARAKVAATGTPEAAGDLESVFAGQLDRLFTEWDRAPLIAEVDERIGEAILDGERVSGNLNFPQLCCGLFATLAGVLRLFEAVVDLAQVAESKRTQLVIFNAGVGTDAFDDTREYLGGNRGRSGFQLEHRDLHGFQAFLLKSHIIRC